ncbi:hypothetical protein FKP32DRAFT_1642490 [Trametes sanguinea]|nr:hypothetical protein FKP32DRAFT_1642490 [Trametes sanguinea]
MANHEGPCHRLSPEILESICRILLHRSNAPEGLKTIANLSMTCKHFRDPALNVLWHTIPDVASLFLVLPVSLYRTEKLQSQYGSRTAAVQLSFNDEPHADQLGPFFQYAQRVRAIDHTTLSSPRFPIPSYAAPSVYDVLAKLLQGRPLFPNMKSLRYMRPGSTPLSIFRSFHILLGPQLQKVYISSSHNNLLPIGVRDNNDEDDKYSAGLLSMLEEKAPALRKVSIILAPSGNLVKSALAPFVRCLTNANLVSVQLVRDLPIDPESFFRLGALPRLRALTVDAKHSAWATDLASDLHHDNLNRSFFPSLRKLQILGSTLATPTKLLSYVSSPVLKELCIDASEDVPRQELHPLFVAIAALPSGRSRLAALAVRIGVVARGDQPVADADPAARVRWAHADDAPDPIGEKTLEPLLGMAQLEDVTLHIPCPFDFDDHLLRRCASSWPEINRLILGDVYAISEYADLQNDPGAESAANEAGKQGNAGEGDASFRPSFWRRPQASILTLEAFAMHCPKLVILGLEVVADLARLPRRLRERRPPPALERHPLNTLFVGLSPIDDPLCVAAFLSDWFPCLAEIHNSWEEVVSDEESSDSDEEDGILEQQHWSYERAARVRWERVETLVSQFIEIRSQERQWRAKAAGLGPSPTTRWEDEAPMDYDYPVDLGSDDSDLA